jgi:hypothetical protein
LNTSLLTRPFEMTNGKQPASASNSSATASAANQAARQPGSFATSKIWNSSLFRQFALSAGDDLRKPPAGEPAAAVPPIVKSDDTGWTFYVPTIDNPFTATNSPMQSGQGPFVDGELVAFLQDATLEPTPQPTDAGARTGENAGKGDSLAGAEKLGEKPEDNTLGFLRAQTVLLKPRESQCDVGINYLLTENHFPILLSNGAGDIVGVTDAKFRVRQISAPIEYRTGLTERVQGFIGAPIGWSNTQITFSNFEDFRNDGGMGDLDFGLTMQLVDAKADSPYWVATISGTAPTGPHRRRSIFGRRWIRAIGPVARPGFLVGYRHLVVHPTV